MPPDCAESIDPTQVVGKPLLSGRHTLIHSAARQRARQALWCNMPTRHGQTGSKTNPCQTLIDNRRADYRELVAAVQGLLRLPLVCKLPLSTAMSASLNCCRSVVSIKPVAQSPCVARSNCILTPFPKAAALAHAPSQGTDPVPKRVSRLSRHNGSQGTLIVIVNCNFVREAPNLAAYSSA